MKGKYFNRFNEQRWIDCEVVRQHPDGYLLVRTADSELLIDSWDFYEQDNDGNQVLYVVVNGSRTIHDMSSLSHMSVMPPEEPHTYGNVYSAAEQVKDLIDEYGHNLDSAQVYRLTLVDPEIVGNIVVNLEDEDD